MSYPDREQDKPVEINENAGVTNYQHEVEPEVVVEKKTVVQKVQSTYKAVTAFVLSLAGFLTLVLSDSKIREALPDNVAAWLIVVGIPAVIGAGTWLKRNEYTVDEAIDILHRAQKRAGI